MITAAAPFGLAPLSGSAPHVGAVGYTLGGGTGLLARTYGYAADQVYSIEVVTPDARLRHVTAESEPELFWALRGGRDNFGVVTGLQVGLVPVSRLYGGGLYFDSTHAAEVLPAWRDWTTTVPEGMTSSLALVPFPDHPAIPDPLRGRHVVHVRLAYTGEPEKGERLIAPLRALGPRLLDTVGEMPYTAAEAIYNDPTTPMGYTGDNALLSELPDQAIASLLNHAGPGAPVPCITELRHLGGALAHPHGPASAIGHRQAGYLLGVLTPLRGGIDADAACSTHEQLRAALAPQTIGRALNFLFRQASPEEVATAYHPDDHQHLVDLKKSYDPNNLFHLGHNIPPQPQVTTPTR